MILGDKKIALVHDWILGIGGAEKVLKVLHEMFPQAPIYTFFYNKRFTDSFLPDADIRPSFLQKIYVRFKMQKFLLPLLPMAAESIDLSDFDIVISSSISFSKGLILNINTTHICYCYSPSRFLWDYHLEYVKDNKYPTIVRLAQHFMRIWDFQASFRVDKYIAISKNVQDRIKKYYRQESEVIYPPVDISSKSYKLKATSSSDFYLIVSRLFPAKNIKLAVEAFNRIGYPLVVIGDGPERGRLEKLAKKNITFLGSLSDEHVNQYYSQCRAFIMPQAEDFGITPIEAMMHGKPVLALRKGGALEFIQESINGEFFDDPAPEVLIDGLRRLNENYSEYNSEKIKKGVEKFSRERFEEELMNYIKNLPI